MQNAYFSHFVRNHWAIPENAILLSKILTKLITKCLKNVLLAWIWTLYHYTRPQLYSVSQQLLVKHACHSVSAVEKVMWCDVVIFCFRAFTETTSTNHPTRWPQLRAESWSNESGQNRSCWCSHYPHDTRTYDGGDSSTHFVNLLDQELGNWRVWCKYHISAVNNILRKLRFILSLLLQRD